MTEPTTVRALFAGPILAQMPRLLTQVDRNRFSPTYGSCCRNFWHYRIEDISNSQMQELVLTLTLAYGYESPDNSYYNSAKLLRWIDAILRYTCSLQRPSGSFDEVYRGQDSYAATAFVSFYVSESLLQLGDAIPDKTNRDCMAMLEGAARWLSRTKESFTANQMAGAAAALVNLAALTKDERYTHQANGLLDDLALDQSDEGWFQEYGGADIGYGSLAQAYLALIHDRTGHDDAKAMALKSATFLRHCIHPDGSVGGEYGSRNTEYFIPLGPMLLHGASDAMADLRRYLVEMMRQGRHEIVARGLDDRYFAYLSPFYMLAAQIAGDLPTSAVESGDDLWAPREVYLPDSGIWSVSTGHYHFVANVKKGGVFRLAYMDGPTMIDDGIFGIAEDGALFTSQYLNRESRCTVDGREARIETELFINKPIAITPLKNVLMRTFNFSVPAPLRRVFLDFLRKKAVSSSSKIGTVCRTIRLSDEGLEATDEIVLDRPAREVSLMTDKERAFSFASTGFFQSYEMELLPGDAHPLDFDHGNRCTVTRTISRDGVHFPAAASEGA